MKESVKLLDKMLEAAIRHPEITPDRVLIISMDKERMAGILTPARLQLIETIKQKQPESVGELCELTKRPIESVSRDLSVLNNYGILEFVQVGRIKRPVIEKDMLLVPLTA